MSEGCRVFGLYDESDILALVASGTSTSHEAVMGFTTGDALRIDDAAGYALALNNDIAVGVVIADKVYFTPGLYEATAHGFTPHLATFYKDPATGRPTSDSDDNERQVLFIVIDDDKLLIPPQFADFR